MMEIASGIAGAIGLSASAGLNAYLPLLVAGLVARYTGLITLDGPWDVLTNSWVLAVLFVLLLVEMTMDKIPVADSLNDIVQTAGRPLAGAILFAAGSGIAGELHPVPAFLAGLLIAGGVHAVKAAARPVITAITGGFGNWLVSLLEDLAALVLAILAILVPLMVPILIMAIALLLVFRRPGMQAGGC